MFNKVFSLIKKVIKQIINMIKDVIKTIIKNPIYAIAGAVAAYMIFNMNKGGEILKEVSGVDPEEDDEPAPEMDDNSMYQDSQEFTAAIADRDSKVEDIVIEAHA